MQTIGPYIIVLSILLVLFAVLIIALKQRTATKKREVSASGIKVEGPVASFSTSIKTSEDDLFEWVEAIVREEPRYSEATQNNRQITFRIRPNMWVWGEIVTLRPRPQATDDKVEMEISCRLRIPTTRYEYGQCGIDLALFLGKLHQKAGLPPFT